MHDICTVRCARFPGGCSAAQQPARGRVPAAGRYPSRGVAGCERRVVAERPRRAVGRQLLVLLTYYVQFVNITSRNYLKSVNVEAREHETDTTLQ